MHTYKADTTVASISELRTKGKEIFKQLRSNRVILERHQKPVAVLINYEKFAVMERMLDAAEDYILGVIALDREQSTKKDDFVDLESW